MSLIGNCLNRLVAAGRLSQRVADQARALHEGMQGRLGHEMPPAQADAYAALEAARVMAAAARERKASIAKQAIAADGALQRVAAHRRGRAAGLMAEMTTDIREGAGGANIEALSEVLSNKMMGLFRPGAEAMQTRWAGLVQDRAVAERFLRELFGEATKDEVAKAAAEGFRAANEWGVGRAKAGGKMFAPAEDWRFPQFWDPGRAREAGEKAWTERVLRHVDSGALRVWDKAGYRPAAPTDIGNVVKSAYHTITNATGEGTGRAFTPEMRVFRFADGKAGADAWLDLQKAFGRGEDIYGVAVGHIEAMAREIAFVDTWGPDYRATFNSLIEQVRQEENAGAARRSMARRFGFESSSAAERTYRALTGEMNGVQSETMAGAFGGVRATLAAAHLGSAIVPSIFGDSVTTALAANYNGLPGTRVVARAVALMVKESPDLRADMARMNLTAFSVVDSLAGSARYLDDNFAGSIRDAFRGSRAPSRASAEATRRFASAASGAANFVIRVQGLQAWTNAMRRSFSMEMLAFVADQQRHAHGNLEPAFRDMLTRRGITADEWEVLRQTPTMEIDGARFFDLEGAADRRLGEKLHAAIVDERRYAILEPSARIRQWTAGGLQRGTFWGEIARSTTAYKSFPVAMVVMHGSRMFAQPGMNRAMYFTKLMLLGTIAGAAAIQAKAVLQGKDPRPMDDPTFWGAAAIQGGGAGIFGDLLSTGVTRGGGGLVATAVGPLGSLVEGLFPTQREASNPGRALARFLRFNTPGSNLWFARLAVDRLLWDEIQTALDPDYRDAFRRTEQRARSDYGQRFWWRPGERAPSRAPDLGAATGGG